MAGGTAPRLLSLLATRVVCQSAPLRCWNRFASPGRPFHSVHLVAVATCCAARIASHSVGATTPTRLPFTSTCALGNLLLSSSPTETSVEPSVLGCTILACSMLGSRTSVAHCSRAVTFDVMTLFLKGLPIMVYSLTGFMGGSPVTVNPM